MNIALKPVHKKKIERFGKTLKYSLHCITSPFDGFWDLTHEHRGSVGAATFIIVLTLLTQIWKLRYTSFLFVQVQWEHVNMLMQIMSLLLPLSIWIIANWSLTTLFDGKGTMKDIYMATGYALTPYVLIQIPLIIVSNFVTIEEGAFYNYFGTFSLIWAGVLILAAVMQIHDFSFGKAILTILATILGMLVIIFILVLFFSLISDCIAYIVSLYKEIVFRMY